MITNICLFRNGMVAVFDQNGQQMPAFQGERKEVMPKIKRRLERQKGLVLWEKEEGVDFDLGDETTKRRQFITR
jgi:hypothetical protein